MTDFRLAWTAEDADLVIEGGDIALDSGVTTGAIVSLFSDGRAPEERLESADQDPRGWWGDPSPDFGSLLWLLLREKRTQKTLELARSSASQALSWLVSEGIAESVDVSASFRGPALALRVEVERGFARRWAPIWDAMDPQVFEAQGVKLDLIYR